MAWGLRQEQNTCTKEEHHEAPQSGTDNEKPLCIRESKAASANMPLETEDQRTHKNQENQPDPEGGTSASFVAQQENEYKPTRDSENRIATGIIKKGADTLQTYATIPFPGVFTHGIFGFGLYSSRTSHFSAFTIKKPML